ncbi:hypothetical protein ACJX0J_008089, partial [Zea mays]
PYIAKDFVGFSNYYTMFLFKRNFAGEYLSRRSKKVMRLARIMYSYCLVGNILQTSEINSFGEAQASDSTQGILGNQIYIFELTKYSPVDKKILLLKIALSLT